MITQKLLDNSPYGYDDSKIITVEEYIENNPKLKTIVTYLNVFGNTTLCLANKQNDVRKTKIYYLLIFTHDHQYEITTKYHESRNYPYISCDMCCMAHKPMEDWRRMRDFTDGDLTDETLFIILSEIIGYECQSLEIDYTGEKEEENNVEVNGNIEGKQ